MQDTTKEVQIVEVDGYPAYLMPSGKVYPFISGGAVGDDDVDDGEDQEDQGDESQDDSGDENDQGDEEEVITQEEMRRIASKEKKDGRRSGRKAVLDELGVSSVEEAKALIAKSNGKSKPDDEDTDDTSEQERAQARRDRERDRRVGKAERALIRAGARDDDRTLAGLVVMLGLEDDFDDDDINQSVLDLKSQNPALFGEAEKKKKTVRPSDPGGKPHKTGTGSISPGKALFAARHGSPSNS